MTFDLIINTANSKLISISVHTLSLMDVHGNWISVGCRKAVAIKS